MPWDNVARSWVAAETQLATSPTTNPDIANFVVVEVVCGRVGFELRPPAAPAPATLEAMGREYMLRALRECDGMIDGAQGAAARLGMHPATLRSMMQRIEIPR